MDNANFHVKISLAKKDGTIHESWIDQTDLTGSPRSNFDRATLHQFVLEQLKRDDLVGLTIERADQTFTIFYWYRAMNGAHVPTSKTCKGVNTFEAAKAMMEADFEGSVTPIVGFVPPDEYLKHLASMKAVVKEAETKKTMIYCLELTIRELEKSLGIAS